MDKMKYDWSEFKINFYYPCSVQEAFRYWSSTEGLKKFFIDSVSINGTEQQEVKSGDGFKWTWRHEYSLEGKYIKVIANELISFTFGGMIVEITFREYNDKTLLQLKQLQISNDMNGMVNGHLNCRSCWIFFMTNLKSIILTGVDLRETEANLASAYEVGYQV